MIRDPWLVLAALLYALHPILIILLFHGMQKGWW